MNRPLKKRRRSKHKTGHNISQGMVESMLKLQIGMLGRFKDNISIFSQSTGFVEMKRFFKGLTYEPCSNLLDLLCVIVVNWSILLESSLEVHSYLIYP